MTDCVCMPMCLEHDCPRPCPICDEKWFNTPIPNNKNEVGKDV